MNLLITRPYKDSLKTKEVIEARTNHKVFISPVLEISFNNSDIYIPPKSNIIITSANGLEALANHSEDRGYNLFLIGRASLEKAKELGYSNLNYSEESLENSTSKNLLKYIISWAEDGERFTHVTSNSGKWDLQKSLEDSGHLYERLELYSVNKLNIRSDIREKIERGFFDGFLFFSEKTAQNFLNNISVSESNLGNKKIFCLSPLISSIFNKYGDLKLLYPSRVDMESFIAMLEE